jgi:hypothetical protein
MDQESKNILTSAIVVAWQDVNYQTENSIVGRRGINLVPVFAIIFLGL